MYVYIYTMMVLGWVAFVLNMIMLGMGIEPKVRTKGNIAFTTVFGLAFTLWATYIIFGGK